MNGPTVTSQPASPARSPITIAWLNMLIAVIQAALIAGFGFALKDRLDLALRERQTQVQERQATVGAIEKMSTLVNDFEKLAAEDAAGRRRIAMHLAMFGTDAAMPLFALAAGSPNTSPKEAIDGLRLLATQHRDAVCQVLKGASGVTGAIPAQRRESILKLADDIGCAAETSAR